MKRIEIITFLIFLSYLSFGQTSLEDCLKNASSSTPLSKLEVIIKQQNDIQTKILNIKKLPQLNLNGQATYQSTTTGLDITLPNVEIKKPSKDQYKLELNATQLIYDGGLVNKSVEIQQLNSQIESISTMSDIDMIKEQIINIYFSILELDARQNTIKLSLEDLTAQMKKMESAVNEGAVLKSNLSQLKAEYLGLDQQRIELENLRKTQIESLNNLTNNTLNITSVALGIPIQSLDELSSGAVNNTYLKRFELQSKLLDKVNDANRLKLHPNVLAFAQAGFGRPGLNFLNNEFAPYYIVGVKLNWNLTGFYSKKKDFEYNRLDYEKNTLRKSNYLIAFDNKNAQFNNEIAKYYQLLVNDDQIIELRKEIMNTAKSQLSNGVITPSDYLIKLDDQAKAVINKNIHQIFISKYKYLLLLNNGKI